MTKRPTLFSLILSMPLLLWQLLFFLFPLLFLVAISFWTVRNFQMQPDLNFGNWERVLTRGVFWDAYFRTIILATAAAAITSVIAFPASYAISFKMREKAKRWMIFILIIPFFTSYLVRVYSLQVFLSDAGIVNAAFGYLGLGPFPMLNNAFGVLVGMVTLTLPLVILLQTFSLNFVNRDLIEVAHNLRCGRLRTVFAVIVPSAKVGLVIAALYVVAQKTAMGLFGPFFIDAGYDLGALGLLSGLGSLTLGLVGALGGGALVRRFSARPVLVGAVIAQALLLLVVALSAGAVWLQPATVAPVAMVLSAAVMALGFVALYGQFMSWSDPRQGGVDFTLRNYDVAVGQYNFARYLLNSVIVSGIVTLLGISFATMAAFAFARFEFRGGNLMFGAVVATLMIPSHITLIPNYLTLARAGMLDSYAGLILPAISSGFAAFFLRQYIRGIPRALDEAERVGALAGGNFLQIAQI